MKAVRCSQCGGAVGAGVGEPAPKCMFCGSAAVEPFEAELVQPEQAIPFVLEGSEVDARFRAWASEGWFTPSELKDASLHLRRLMVPAWVFRGFLEVHWSGQARARSASGYRPVTGRFDLTLHQLLVPASRTLLQGELDALGTWDEDELAPFDAEANEVPFEVSELSAEGAQARGRRAAIAMARAEAEAQCDRAVRVAPVVGGLRGEPVWLPLWIGTFEHDETAHRVLVHGVTGVLVGHRPSNLSAYLWMAVKIVAYGAGVAALLGVVAMLAYGLLMALGVALQG